MPHQCLQCGKIFPGGSVEILKGCAECGGKRFFYTNQPISSEQREVLKEQANQDVKSLIRDMLTQREPFEKYTSDDLGEVGGPGGEEWIKVEPGKGKIKPVTAEEIRKPFMNPEAGELGPAERVESEVRGKAKPKTKLKPIRKTRRKPLKHRKVPKRKKVTKEKIKVKEIKPDVIKIVEPGVYEIDLKRLLEENPIIVQKDGTYFVHLPSIFEKIKKKAS